MRRLTDRQVAVLAAVERLGSPTLPSLHAEFPHLEPSTILRVLDALNRRSLIDMRGNPEHVYLGDPEELRGELAPGARVPVISPEEIVRFSSPGLARASR